MPFLTPKHQRWYALWPNRLVGLLGLIQLLLNLSIIGLELTSVLFDYVRSTSFAGFYCSIFFTITWLSMFSVTCCNRHSIAFATHALIENILSLAAAILIIVFDSVFIAYPFTCIFGTSYCAQANFFSNSSSLYGINNPTNYEVKMSCIKAQLACAALVLATNVFYIVIFTIVAVKVHRGKFQTTIIRHSTVHPSQWQRQEITYTSSSQSQSLPAPSMVPCVRCHNCQVLVPIPSDLNLRNEMNTSKQIQNGTSLDRQNTMFTSTVTQSNGNGMDTATTMAQQARPVTVASSILGSAYAKQTNRTSINSVTQYTTKVSADTVYHAHQNGNSVLSPYEITWRAKFLRIPCAIIAVMEVIFAGAVCALEIASLILALGYLPTGVGIWSSVPVTIAGVLTAVLALRWRGSRVWSTRVLIAQIIAIIFTTVLLGFTGNYVQTNGYSYIYGSNPGVYLAGNYLIKYQLTIAQLAFAGVLLCAEMAYVALYIYITIVALWLPHHTLDLPHLFRA